MTALCPPWPALLLENGEKTLVVADLHLGFEFELSEKGISLPSQTGRLKERLLKILDETEASSLIILGDFKHTIPKVSLQEWRDIPLFLEEVGRKASKIRLVLGNHDGGIEVFAGEKLEVHPSRGILLEAGNVKVGLFHGHAWPSPKLFEASYWIIGHNHPAVQFRGYFGFRMFRQAWIKAPINRRRLIEDFLKSRGVKMEGKPEKVLEEKYNVKPAVKHLVIMPAFNDLLGGLAFNAVEQEELLGPVTRSRGVLMEKAEVYLTDGSFLGSLKSLRKYG
ncbi:MAG: phosphoesterase [Candidatus Hecatellales archaeon]|nr:MAG: phosphoesterase [Candidatus Hecatellales archaeon]